MIIGFKNRVGNNLSILRDECVTALHQFLPHPPLRHRQRHHLRGQRQPRHQLHPQVLHLCHAQPR
jgi:hypothetical protein